MKAYLLKDIGKFECADVEEPVCGSNEVIVKVATAGVCGSDIPRIYRTGAYTYPLIPGHEFSGTVLDVGKDTDRSWIGKRVGIFPMIPCKKCGPCLDKSYELCRSYSYLGSRRAGGFAEQAAVPVWNLIELPDSVSFEQAAMLEPMAVAVHAMRRSGVDTADSVVVCGLGTIGLLLYLLLKEKGIKRIYLIGNKKYQEEVAGRLGADKDCFCNNHIEDADDWLDYKISSGVNLFFDCAGTEETVGLALRHTAPNGTTMIVGNPPSQMEFDKQTFWRILRNQLTVKGTWNSSFMHTTFDDWHYCLDLIAQKRVVPEKLISHRFPFDMLGEGIRMMRDKKEGYTKVMAFL